MRRDTRAAAVVRVINADESVDVYANAAHEVGRDGHLRVVVFESGEHGLWHAVEARVRTLERWVDVQVTED